VTDTDIWAGLESAPPFDPQPVDGILADGRPVGDRTAGRGEMFDHDAEASVLGACLLNPAVLDELPPLTVADFHKPQHGLVWEALQDMHTAGQRIDPTLVVAHMADAGTLIRAGGGPFVHDLMHAVPTAANGGYYAARVAEVSRRRALAAFAAGVNQVTGTPVDADAMIEEIRRRLDMIDEPDLEGGPVRWADMVTEGMDAIEAAANPADSRAIPTGLTDLDGIIHGLRPGDLDIIGGRPGDGKSTLALQIAAHVGLDLKLPTLVCSLEMKRPEIYNRVVASRLSINLNQLTTGKLSDDAWSKLSRQAGISADAPFWVDDNTDQTLASIQALARRWKRRHGLRLLVIDYLQLVKGPKAENRQNEVGAISRGLKVLASQLDIPILVAAQLNRNKDQRSDKSPQLSDLRESGSLESDAAVVILLDRPENTDRRTVRKGEADAIVAKHRHGPQGTAKLAAQLHLARFASMAGFDQFGATR
jgi:replicative DNA helicase